MKITQVRNATLLVEFAGTKLLIDPMFADKGSTPAFPGTPNSDRKNPVVDLPLPIARLIDVDGVVVTHLHRDHWDDAAANAIAKGMPLFVQNSTDATKMVAAGFQRVHILEERAEFRGVTMYKTAGQHGSDDAIARIGDRLGSVCGIALKAPSEKCLYIAGDTVWNSHVVEALATHDPDIVVLNCGNAVIDTVGAIIMGADDVRLVAEAAPRATIVASHMEAVNHCTLPRTELKRKVQEWGLSSRVHIPQDGESLSL